MEFDTTCGELKENAPVQYDVRHNPAIKPPYSFSGLIFMAIEAWQRQLPVKDMYN